ncbi:MAG: fibronectin type III domain-containing protein, partial [Nanoarchaeota archaeon]
SGLPTGYVWNANGTIDGSAQLTVWTNITLQNGSISVATLYIDNGNTSTKTLPAATYSSATVTFNHTHTSAAGTLTFLGNVVFTGNVTFQTGGAAGYTIANGTNNPNVEFRGNVALTQNTGAITWTKGTGTITLGNNHSDGTQTIDFLGKSIEDLVINAPGDTKQLTANVTVDTLTDTSGTLNRNGYTITVLEGGGGGAGGGSDTTPPVRSAGSPTGQLASGTTQTTLSLVTNENSTCRYSTTSGTAYASMIGILTTTGTTSHSTTITGLSNGTSYNYYIRCQDTATSPNVNTDDYLITFSVASPSSDTTVPSTPTGLTATIVSSSQINLSWTASTDNVGVTGYRIYRGGTQIATSATNSYQNTGLTASTSYSYTVSAYDAAGNVSAQSGSASASTQAVPNSTSGVVENLDEMFARKARRATATWGAQYLENPATYVWQPETLMYQDVTTGHEVWKLSDTPRLGTSYHSDIGVSPWSADGSKVAYTAYDRFTRAYSQSQQQEWRYIWMTSNTNGASVRPTVEAHRRLGGGYFHWSPQQPNTWFEIGESHLASGGQSNVLYRSAVDAQGVVTSQAILTLPAGAAGTSINKLLSADGRRIVLEQSNRFWPISIRPDGTVQLDDPDGYSIDRGFGPYGGMNGGTVTGFHDQYIADTGDYFFVMPNDPGSTATWWRIKTAGSASDGGPLYTGDNGQHNFGEIWPENHGAVKAGNLTSPFADPGDYNPNSSGYWSHFVPDRWGTHALFSNSHDNVPGGYGPGVWDFINHEWVVPSFGGGAQHHDWHGFTDWFVSSGGPSDPTGRGRTQVLAANINDPASRIVVNNAYTRYDGGTSYNSLIRPGQSPDGTKVAWHSEFLNGANLTDIFWSVVYYPYPATDLAAGIGTGVNLSFLPPKYTERRWINPTT